jgi:hypothetical protein
MSNAGPIAKADDISKLEIRNKVAAIDKRRKDGKLVGHCMQHANLNKGRSTAKQQMLLIIFFSAANQSIVRHGRR